MKTTPWIPGFEKPLRVGLYQRRYDGNGNPRWGWWDGDRWMATQVSKELALRFNHCESFYQELQWRGLTVQAYLEHQRAGS
jgi:hypothetical protein